MQIRKLIITTVISGILVIGAVTVGAQEDTGRRSNLRTFGQSELIQEYTGLTGQELLVALQDGSTIAELIEANGESVDAFIAEAMTGAEEVLIERLNEPITINRNLSLGNVFDYAELVEEFTGMTTQEVREAIVDDSTLGELIEANGESIDDFVVEVMASVQTRADEAVEAGTIDQEAADERLTQFEDTLTQGLEEGFDFNFGNRNRGGRR